MFFIVPAAGHGSRLHSKIPKQYILYKNKPLIYYTLKILAHFNLPIILVVSPNDQYIKNYADILPKQTIIIYQGGAFRAQSVYNGLKYLKNSAQFCIKPSDWILVHDAARPLVKIQDIKNLVNICIENQNTQNFAGGILASPIVDTIKKIEVGKDNIKYIDNLAKIDRNTLYLAQTPQMFKFSLLNEALEHAITRARDEDDIKCITDEASAIEGLGFKPCIIPSSKLNIKITHKEDLLYLKFLDDEFIY